MSLQDIQATVIVRFHLRSDDFPVGNMLILLYEQEDHA